MGISDDRDEDAGCRCGEIKLTGNAISGCGGNNISSIKARRFYSFLRSYSISVQLTG